MRRKLPPCFKCGKHLWGSKHVKLRHKIDDHVRVFHKHCAEELLKQEPIMCEEVEG